MDPQASAELNALVEHKRWAALATTNADGTANVSQVAFARARPANVLLFHLSTLAKHTRNLLDRPHCSISISELDDGRMDPQTLARVALTGTIAVVTRTDSRYVRLRDTYLQRLPQAAPRFDFGDFHLLEMDITKGQFVGGFARAFKVNRSNLTDATSVD